MIIGMLIRSLRHSIHHRLRYGLDPASPTFSWLAGEEQGEGSRWEREIHFALNIDPKGELHSTFTLLVCLDSLVQMHESIAPRLPRRKPTSRPDHSPYKRMNMVQPIVSVLHAKL